MDGLPYHNKTSLKDVAAEQMSIYRSHVPDFQLLSSGSNATFSGIPTYKIEYKHTSGRLQISTMEIFTIKGNEAYKIIFSADTPDYTALLSTVEKMVDSFNVKSQEQQPKVAHV